MCGIFGYFDNNNNRISDNILQKMGQSIKHRGPDGQGYYHDSSQAVAVGNQRLAILDIEHGQQPFVSDDQNIYVVQNGEIFNHLELAQELASEGYTCNTHCDTEVILRLYERDGIDGIAKLNGMFAIAIYDKKLGALYLVRDRVGEKPLYYYQKNEQIVFSSEIKSILEAVDYPGLNYQALNDFLAFNYVPPPLTMFENIKHVMPGHWLKISERGVENYCWWDVSKISVVEKSESQWVDDFNTILADSVKIRLRADVPFGAFLSGGVDSSTVVGLMSHNLKDPVNTFSIGFNDPKYDESPFAQAAAERFSTNHILQKVEPNLIQLWPMATYHCDQPHGDVSFLPTYKVASLASEHVKMVLTGDGADELFAGYDKYKSFFNDDINQISDSEFQEQYTNNILLFDTEGRKKLFSEGSLEKIASLNAGDTLKPLYEKAADMDRINQALYIDTMLLLSGNNLVKPDRMGMAVSIENRAPFLDYRMIELAFSMPGNIKLKDQETKYIYKKAVAPLIGEALAYRQKQMFTVPVGDWFKGELAELCNDLLLSKRVTERKLFDYDYVRRLYDEHCSGVRNNTREIRALMALEIWFRLFVD
ncbi:asparagine synthase (glutamine-hydrolyzing) [Endozoicomonas ascidiicola]|uniref:asparagine synthase (glutamine-hydrolyzing) n=1 Tax=Endozoicomonas ascidiicola TaxID=1698521 RepID=UPI00082F3A03|nr:asparagine synthase (glutamine-hydrolyzing) [Endozoicomonas ascidiicola]